MTADVLRGSSAARELWSVFRVAHFPAERRDPLAQFVAAFPILFPPRVLALFFEFGHFGRNIDHVSVRPDHRESTRSSHQRKLLRKREHSVDALPPMQPSVSSCGI